MNGNIGQKEYNIWQIECYIYYTNFNNSTFSGIWISQKDNFFSLVFEENSWKFNRLHPIDPSATSHILTTQTAENN
jgi:hypothetical protein